MMKSIPIIVIVSGIVFFGITIQNLIKFAATEVLEEKLEWKKASLLFLVLAIISIVIGVILIKIL